MIINPILNITNCLINPNISVLKHNDYKSLFYYTLQHNDNVMYFDVEDIVQNYFYDIFLTNDVLLQNPIHNNISDSQIKTILVIHQKPPAFFKKEDMLLHRDSTKNIPKICFETDIAEEWGILQDENTYLMEYCMPTISVSETNATRTKNIAILNLENNPHIDRLYQIVQSRFNDTIMIKNINSKTNINDLIKIMQQCKLIIDINSKCNILYALSCGCQCITARKVQSALVSCINDYSNINSILQDLLSIEISESQRCTIAKQTEKTYSCESFNKILFNILNTYKQQPYQL